MRQYPIDVLIPTYNRPDFLKRILDYFQEYGQDFSYIVGDSSKPEIRKQNKRLINTYKNLNILYLDKLPGQLTLHEKLGEMTKFIKQKYSVFCPDDDFIVPEVVKECVNFLEKNPDYVCAHGTYIGYHPTRSLLGKPQVLWKLRYSPATLSSNKAEERLFAHMKDYRMVLWSVRRSDVVKIIYKDFLKIKFDKYLMLNMGELLPDVLTVVYGKVKNINSLYGARQYFGSINGHYASFIDAKNNDRYDKEYKKFKDCVSKNLVKLSKISIDKADQIIDQSMNEYTKFSYQEHLINKITFYLSHFPRLIPTSFRYMHAKYLFSKPAVFSEFQRFINSSKQNKIYFKSVNKYLTQD